MQLQIGFIGAGQMATALAQGFVRAGLAAAAGVIASDPAADARQRFAEATGGRTTASNIEAAGGRTPCSWPSSRSRCRRCVPNPKGKIAETNWRFHCRRNPCGPRRRLGRTQVAGAGHAEHSLPGGQGGLRILSEPAGHRGRRRTRQAIAGSGGDCLSGGRKIHGCRDRTIGFRPGVRVSDDRGPWRRGGSDGVAPPWPRPWPPKRFAGRPRWSW